MITVFIVPHIEPTHPSDLALESWRMVPPPPTDRVGAVITVDPLVSVVEADADGHRPAWIFGSDVPVLGLVELHLDSHDDWASSRDRVIAHYTDAHDGLAGVRGISVVTTRDNVVVEGPVGWRDEPSVKATFFASRRPDVGLVEFGRHWREDHAALVPETPHLVRYVQGHVTDVEYIGGTAPRFDGIAQLWWPTTELMGQAMESHTMQVTQPQDAAEFVDLAAQFGFVGRERILLAQRNSRGE